MVSILEESKRSPASRAKMKYNAKNYERIPLDVKIGTKAIYKAAAAAENLSLNAFIQKAIEEKMDRKSKETPPA
jgi:predicted HicB family RNase H-like nuclease